LIHLANEVIQELLLPEMVRYHDRKERNCELAKNIPGHERSIHPAASSHIAKNKLNMKLPADL
jgi:hypothetical protein